MKFISLRTMGWISNLAFCYLFCLLERLHPRIQYTLCHVYNYITHSYEMSICTIMLHIYYLYIYIVSLSAGPVMLFDLEAVSGQSSNCHGFGLSGLVLGEFGAIPTLALLHDGLCTFDVSWISAVPCPHGARTHSASRFHGAGETSHKNGQVSEQNETYDL